MDSPTIAYTLVPSPGHTLQGHPENSDRFMYFHKLEQSPFSDQLRLIDPRIASHSEVSTVHPPEYLQVIKNTAAQGPGFVDHGDTYVTPASFKSSLEAAGGVIEIVRTVIEGKVNRGFALVRPPGHHATATRAMGFCLVNNIAIAARYAQSQGLQRIMIIDFDVHHGNGTQDIFEDDPNLLFLSTHQSGIYPGTGMFTEVGVDEGAGTVVNIPLPARAGDVAIEAIFEHLISPLAQRFDPDILLVSAGFDAHWNDPLAGLQFSTRGYYQLGMWLSNLAERLCQGRIAYFLEGGYDPRALFENVAAIFHSLAGTSPPTDRLGPAPLPEPEITPLINKIRSIHGL